MLTGDFTIRVSSANEITALINQAQGLGLSFLGLIADHDHAQILSQEMAISETDLTLIPGISYSASQATPYSIVQLIAYWPVLPPAEAIPPPNHDFSYLAQLVHGQGGVIVLAAQQAPDFSIDLVALKRLGLDGIESINLEEIKGEHGDLFIVGGSKHPEDYRLVCKSELPWRLISGANRYLAHGLKICLLAAEQLRAADFGSRGASYKEQNHQDLLTWHDSNTERTISAGILARWPEHWFIGEEASSRREWLDRHMPSGKVWILDPIDGTANFTVSHRDYTISLALFSDGIPELGIVIDCRAGIVWTSEKGRGARKNGKLLQRLGSGRPLEEATFDASLNAMLALADRGADLRSLGKACRGHRAAGCASLNFCRIADGSLDLYFSSRLGIWDWAAGLVILNEVGGKLWQSPLVKGQANGLRDKSFCLGASSETLAMNFFKAMGIGEFFQDLTNLNYSH